MSRLTHCITVINEWSGPALTQYGQERVELGGPVVSRWLAKIANYLTNELAADLFGTGEPTPTRIYTTLQPWQDTLWQITARAMGWEVLDTRRPLPGDLFVTNILGSEASNALDAGAHVLAQPAQYLSFAWDGPLEGAMDGLAEIAMQPDALVVDTHPLLGARPWPACARRHRFTVGASRCCGTHEQARDRCWISGCRGARSSSLTRRPSRRIISPRFLPRRTWTEAS